MHEQECQSTNEPEPDVASRQIVGCQSKDLRLDEGHASPVRVAGYGRRFNLEEEAFTFAEGVLHRSRSITSKSIVLIEPQTPGRGNRRPWRGRAAAWAQPYYLYMRRARARDNI
ncbi:hypothetical protein EVAR_30863_1 [Eumeta japonica]|uniref:Uncharacterized protein n=1 Tax=Eumeta variegata TaxID=151549 RepID=A0A4C1XRX0_EUMVA|nr:hypothetical protein EVAR_30863_1 [Eumeta japonica]